MLWAGIDLKVQPQEPLVLKGVENTDWRLLQGDPDVRVEVRHWPGSLTPLGSVLPGGLCGWEGLGELEGIRESQPNSLSCVQRNDSDQVELWGLKEGTYLFQLTLASSNQPDNTANITVTVLSTKQTEGEGGWGSSL